MREIRTSGSAGALGEQSPGATQTWTFWHLCLAFGAGRVRRRVARRVRLLAAVWSEIRLVQRICRDTTLGTEHAVLAARHLLYLRARNAKPQRWARHTRNWSPLGEVLLNPQPKSG